VTDIPGVFPGKPVVNLYGGWDSWKERRIEWPEEEIEIGQVG
jgi:hypothetical protein